MRRAAGTAPLGREPGTEQSELPPAAGGRARKGGARPPRMRGRREGAHCACAEGRRGEGRAGGCPGRLRGEPALFPPRTRGRSRGGGAGGSGETRRRGAGERACAMRFV